MGKKQQTITFRVTNDEYKMIKEKAKNSNLTMTKFIVQCCSEKEVVISNYNHSVADNDN